MAFFNFALHHQTTLLTVLYVYAFQFMWDVAATNMHKLPKS